MPLIVSSTGCPQVADKARRLLMPVLRYDSVFSLDDIQVKLAQTPQANRVLSSVQSFHSFHSLCTHTNTHRGSIWVDWRFCSRAKFSLLFTFPHTIQIQQQQQRQQTESDISLVSQSTSDDSRLGILFYYSRQSSWRQIAKKEEFLFKIKCE